MPFESQFGIWIDASSLLDSKTPPMSAEVYENGVRTIVMKISHSKVGRAVLTPSVGTTAWCVSCRT